MTTTLGVGANRAVDGQNLAPAALEKKEKVKKISIDFAKVLDPEIEKAEAKERTRRIVRNVLITTCLVAAVAAITILTIPIFVSMAPAVPLLSALGCFVVFMLSCTTGSISSMVHEEAEKRVAKLKAIKADLTGPECSKFLHAKKIKQKEYTFDELLKLHQLFLQSAAPSRRRKAQREANVQRQMAFNQKLATFQ